MSTRQRFKSKTFLFILGILGLLLISYMYIGVFSAPKVTEMVIVLHKPFSEKAIKKFNSDFPDIKIKFVVRQEDSDAALLKFKTEFVAGESPDVFWFLLDRIKHCAERNILVNLSPYIKKEALDLSIFNSKSLESCKWNGSIYGLPPKSDCSIFYGISTQSKKKKEAWQILKRIVLDSSIRQSITVAEMMKKKKLDKEKKYTKLLKELQKNIKKQPKDPILYIYLGNIHYKYKKFNMAIKAYNKSVEIDPDCIDGYIGRAACYACLWKLKEAEVNINKALSLDPKNKNALEWKEWIRRAKQIMQNK